MIRLADILFSRTLQVLATLLLILGSGLALYYGSLLQFDEHQEDLFRTDEHQYARYQYYAEHFPAEQQEISILIQADQPRIAEIELLNAENLSTLLALRHTLERLPAAAHVISIFAVPRLESLATKASDGDNEALLELKRKLSNPGYWPAKLLSENQQVMVFVVELQTEGDQSAETLKRLLGEIDRSVTDSLNNSSLSAQVTGFPSLRIALRDQIKLDSVKYTTLAFLFSMLVAFLYFRSGVLVIATLIGPLAAVLCVFGLMSAAGMTVNVLTQMVGVLILVVTYSDSLHLIAHCRRNLTDGLSSRHTLRSALMRIGPACLLTSLTSAAGFVSLALSNSPTIVQFGVLCAVGTLIGFIAVMLSLPLIMFICSYHVRRLSDKRGDSERHGATTPGSTKGTKPKKYRLDSFIIASGILLTVFVLGSSTQLKTDYSFTENLPTDHPARTALALADESMNGQLPLHIMLEWSPDVLFKRRQMIGHIRALQKELKEATGKDWFSISDLIRMTPGFGTLSKLKQLPPYAVEHFFLPRARVAIVTTHMTSAGAHDIREFMAVINPVLETFQQSHTGVSVEVAGFLSLVGSGSQYMISDLAKSLFGAIVVIFVLNVLLFRSYRLGLISLMPNIAPIAAVGAALFWTDEPLRYSSVVLFSICLGLAIDDTVHYIVRFRQHQRSGVSVRIATQLTTREVGSVLILTTFIMCAGFAALLISTTPAVVSMGALACVALIVALLSDLLLLPALLRRFS